MNDIQNHSKGEIVMYQPDETIRLEVRVENDTVWLTQAQMAELFRTTPQNVTIHIKDIYEEEELSEGATCKQSLQVRQEGKRTVRRYQKMYNLDVIISVGYRVKSKRGTQFRQWANGVLKEFLLRGYSVNQRLMDLENKFEKRIESQDVRIDKLENDVAFFVRTSLPPVEGIFYDGQIFDAYAHIVSLIKQAKHSIVLIDNYIDESTLMMLSKRDAGVSATIYTHRLSQQQQLDLQRHNQQYPPITICSLQHTHDRFLIIDDTVYLFGASLKDAGKKLFAYIKMQETSDAELLSRIR